MCIRIFSGVAFEQLHFCYSVVMRFVLAITVLVHCGFHTIHIAVKFDCAIQAMNQNILGFDTVCNTPLVIDLVVTGMDFHVDTLVDNLRQSHQRCEVNAKVITVSS